MAHDSTALRVTRSGAIPLSVLGAVLSVLFFVIHDQLQRAISDTNQEIVNAERDLQRRSDQLLIEDRLDRLASSLDEQRAAIRGANSAELEAVRVGNIAAAHEKYIEAANEYASTVAPNDPTNDKLYANLSEQVGRVQRDAKCASLVGARRGELSRAQIRSIAAAKDPICRFADHLLPGELSTAIIHERRDIQHYENMIPFGRASYWRKRMLYFHVLDWVSLALFIMTAVIAVARSRISSESEPLVAD
jgi:hypothetical protein